MVDYNTETATVACFEVQVSTVQAKSFGFMCQIKHKEAVLFWVDPV